HKSLIAAARFLLGAVRCGAVTTEAAEKVLASLQRLAKENGPGIDRPLLRWYLESRRISGIRLLSHELYGKRVLLLDDECASAGWNLVFREIFGSGFVGTNSALAAHRLLDRQSFDV